MYTSKTNVNKCIHQGTNVNKCIHQGTNVNKCIHQGTNVNKCIQCILKYTNNIQLLNIIH
jgi:hypothetical protein